MKINEVTGQARVTRSTGNEVEIDNGDGTKTTIDTKKNPNAISQDEKGNVTVNTEPANSAQRGSGTKTVRPGQRVNISRTQ